MVSRVLNCQWDNKLIKPIFHIVEAKGLMLLGLPTLRRMGLFQKHLRVFTENMDIQQMQKYNLARCVTGGDMSDNDNNANEQISVSDTECLDK